MSFSFPQIQQLGGRRERKIAAWLNCKVKSMTKGISFGRHTPAIFIPLSYRRKDGEEGNAERSNIYFLFAWCADSLATPRSTKKSHFVLRKNHPGASFRTLFLFSRCTALASRFARISSPPSLSLSLRFYFCPFIRPIEPNSMRTWNSCILGCNSRIYVAEKINRLIERWEK